MAQPQYYEILNEGDKNPEQRFFTNVEDQTVQYVITPDKTQVQFPTQQITQDQVLQTQIIQQQPIVQQPIQIQAAPQFAVIKDGALTTTEGQPIFFVENTIPDGIVVEKNIQHPPQPIVLNHQLAQTAVVRNPVKAGPNSLELMHQKQKAMQRNPNQTSQVRQGNPVVTQMRQQMGNLSKQPVGQVHSPNLTQTQMRPQQQPIRQGIVRTGQNQFRPQQQHSMIRPTEQNQVRQQLRIPNQNVQHRPNLLRNPNMVINPLTHGMIQQQPQQQQSPQLSKFGNQAATVNEGDMNSSDEPDTVSLPDGTLVTMTSYKKMLANQKPRNVALKQGLVQQNNQMQSTAPVQQPPAIQQQNSPMQQQSLIQQSSATGNSNIRPQMSPTSKKRAATPRAPRAQGKAPPRSSRPRLAPIGQPQQQQQTNTQGPFSLLNQQQQVNKPQTQQFQNQVQMSTPMPAMQPAQTHNHQQMSQQQQPQVQQPSQLQPQSQLQQQSLLLPQSQLQQQSQLQPQSQLQQQQQHLQQQQQQQNQIQQQQHQPVPRNKPSQANYVIQPPKSNQKPLQQRPLPAYIPSSQIQKIIESTPIGEEFSDSIRMLVLLDNGEQRLITFTLPKEACTIQEILEQVNVPFQNDTNIQVIETNSDGINYIVTVGNVPNVGLSDEEAHPPPPPPPPEKPSTPPLVRTQPPLSTQPPQLPSIQQLPKSQPLKQVSPVTTTSTNTTSTTPTTVSATQQQKTLEVPRKSPSPDPVKDIPKFVNGMLALCGACGYLSEDFSKCIRCSRKLPDTVKAVPANLRGNSGGPKRDIAAIALAQQQKHQVLQQQQQAAAQCQQLQPKTNPTSTKAASPQKKKSTRSKTVEESVHVISSDEEEEEGAPKLSENLLQKLGNSVTICPISKEPSTIDIQRHCSSKTPAKVFAEKDLVKTKLKCRTVRIGSYRCIPAEEVIIDSVGVTIKVPHPSKEKGVKVITLEKTNTVKVLVSFNSSLPVVFYYLNSALAMKIREQLDMTSDSDYYFDPLSLEDEAQRRITLLPDDITEDNKNIIQLVYGYPINIMEELNVKEANDILIKTCPKDVARSVPGFGAFAEIKQLLTYPPEGRYRITINTEDYICLAQDQFLNDVIIDFYLTYLIANLPEHQKSKVHVFSTFFYRRLTTKPVKASRKSQPSELDPTLSPAQKRHARVKKWTKNVNIFEKDFIVVPINENAHWFLAIICFPGMHGCQTWDGKPYKIEVKSKKNKKNPTTVSVGNIALTIKQEKISKPIPCDDPDMSDKDEAEGDDSEMESDDSEEVPLSQNGQTASGIATNSTSCTPPPTPTPIPAPTPTHTPRGPKEVRPPLKMPCILIFDSLSGATRSRVVATLRDYLTCEYKSKMGKERTYNKDVIKGASPKVPQQNNFTDCGLYLLQYVEQFFVDPIKDFHIPIKQIQNWFEEITVTKKREDIANLIKRLMKEYGKDLRLVPDVAFPTLNGKIVERDMEDEEDEEEMMEEEDEDCFSREDSLLTMNTSKDSLSDGMSSESDMRYEEAESPIKPSNENNSSDFVTQPVVNAKPDLSEFPRQTSKDTLSILKAKRIIRHKNVDGPNVKKLRGEQN